MFEKVRGGFDEPLTRPSTMALQVKRGAGSPTVARDWLIMLRRSISLDLELFV